MNKKYRIGEVAKLFNISTDIIRHYEKLKILKPKRDEISGYRYYTLKDIEHLEMIRMLRDMDVSLDEIKNIRKIKNKELLKEFLNKQEKNLDAKIQALLDMKSRVRTLKKDIEEIDKYEKNIVIKKRPNMYFLKMGIADDEKEPDLETIMNLNEENKNKIIRLGRYGAILEEKNLNKESFLSGVKYGFIFEEKIEDKNLELTFIEPQECVFTIITCTANEFKDEYEESYKEIIKWIKGNNYEISGKIIERDIIMLDGEYGDSVSNYETWIPIKKCSK